MLTLVGNRMNPQMIGVKRLGSVCNTVTRMIHLCMTIKLLYGFILDSFIAADRMLTANEAAYLSYGIMSGIMLLTFACRIKRIRWLIETLSHRHCASIRVKSLAFLLLTLASVIFKIACTISVYVRNEDVSESVYTTSLIDFLLDLPDAMNQFHVIYPSVYLLAMHMLTMYEVTHLQSCVDRLDASAIIMMMTERRNIMRVKSEFESLFNLIPLISFMIPFFTIPGMIAGATQATCYDCSRFDLICYAASQVKAALFIILLVKQAHVSRRRVHHATNDLITVLHQRQMSMPATSVNQALMHELIHELGSDQREFCFTGWSLFVIDARIIPAFLSALITMSMLQLQLQ